MWPDALDAAVAVLHAELDRGCARRRRPMRRPGGAVGALPVAAQDGDDCRRETKRTDKQGGAARRAESEDDAEGSGLRRRRRGRCGERCGAKAAHASGAKSRRSWKSDVSARTYTGSTPIALASRTSCVHPVVPRPWFGSLITPCEMPSSKVTRGVEGSFTRAGMPFIVFYDRFFTAYPVACA